MPDAFCMHYSLGCLISATSADYPPPHTVQVGSIKCVIDTERPYWVSICPKQPSGEQLAWESCSRWKLMPLAKALGFFINCVWPAEMRHSRAEVNEVSCLTQTKREKKQPPDVPYFVKTLTDKWRWHSNSFQLCVLMTVIGWEVLIQTVLCVPVNILDLSWASQVIIHSH